MKSLIFLMTVAVAASLPYQQGGQSQAQTYTGQGTFGHADNGLQFHAVPDISIEIVPAGSHGGNVAQTYSAADGQVGSFQFRVVPDNSLEEQFISQNIGQNNLQPQTYSASGPARQFSGYQDTSLELVYSPSAASQDGNTPQTYSGAGGQNSQFQYRLVHDQSSEDFIPRNSGQPQTYSASGSQNSQFGGYQDASFEIFYAPSSSSQGGSGPQTYSAGGQGGTLQYRVVPDRSGEDFSGNIAYSGQNTQGQHTPQTYSGASVGRPGQYKQVFDDSLEDDIVYTVPGGASNAAPSGSGTQVHHV